jgi:predicted MPP superfamily phosphohydrolase
MSFIAKIIFVLVVCDLVWWFQGHRLLTRVPQPRWWQLALALFMIAQIIGLTLVMASRVSPLAFLLPRAFLAEVYLWHCIVLLPLTVIAVAVGLARFIIKAAKVAVRYLGDLPAAPTAERPATPVWSRREFLAASAAAAPAILTLGATGAAIPQLEQFRIRRFTIRLSSLPPELDGFTIAHVSDMHVGRFTSRRVLEKMVTATNDLRAGLVLLTGDLINDALHDLPVALETVRALKGEHGVFMCEGNHDLIEDGVEFTRQTRAAGVALLRDEATIVSIGGRAVQLLGLPWGSGGAGGSRATEHGDTAIASSMRRLLAQRQPNAFPILLAHPPHAFDFAEGVPLTLAGHTHGGQLMLNERVGFGPILFRYWSGLYERAGQSLVVSNGVGNWFPLRTRAPAEILHLTLRRADPTSPAASPSA